MRQKIFTLSAMAALLFLAVGCTNDDDVQENGKGDSGKNEEAVVIFESKAPTTETSQDVTRTSITHQVSKGATAYWSPGDCIWVEEDDKSINKSAPATHLDGNPIKATKAKRKRMQCSSLREENTRSLDTKYAIHVQKASTESLLVR